MKLEHRILNAQRLARGANVPAHHNDVRVTSFWFAMRAMRYTPADIVSGQIKLSFPTGPVLTPGERAARDKDIRRRMMATGVKVMTYSERPPFDLTLVYQLLLSGLTHMIDHGSVESGTPASRKLVCALRMCGEEVERRDKTPTT